MTLRAQLITTVIDNPPQGLFLCDCRAGVPWKNAMHDDDLSAITVE